MAHAMMGLRRHGKPAVAPIPRQVVSVMGFVRIVLLLTYEQCALLVWHQFHHASVVIFEDACGEAEEDSANDHLGDALTCCTNWAFFSQESHTSSMSTY